MAGMQILDQFSDKLNKELIEGIKKTMHTACIGNSKRYGGFHGDDMWPSYTNVSVLYDIADDLALVLALCLYYVYRTYDGRPGSYKAGRGELLLMF